VSHGLPDNNKRSSDILGASSYETSPAPNLLKIFLDVFALALPGQNVF
jgi:hypothetical protein